MIAFVREVVPQLGKSDDGQRCESDFDEHRAKQEHGAFAKVLGVLGASVEMLPTIPDQPCGTFVGDMAVALPEVVVIGRPAAAPRLGEIDSITRIIGQYRLVESIVAPGTLDGGDVLRIGHTLYAAESLNTNADGIGQLREIVRPHGYEVSVVTIRDCARLKAGCTFVPPHFVVVNPAQVDVAPFRTFITIHTDEHELGAADTLTLGKTTLVRASGPKTEKRLKVAGVATRRVDVSEFEKLDAGLTRLALILESRVAKAPPGNGSVMSVNSAGAPSRAAQTPQAMIHRGVVYTSPQLPFAGEAMRGRRMDVEDQAEHAIRNLSSVLAAAGSSLNRTLRLTIHLADPKHASRVEPVVTRLLGSHQPACSFVANGVLGAGVLIQIEAIAAVSEDG